MTLTRKSLAFISLTIAFLLACSTLSDLDLSINSQIEINAPTESAINLALTEQAQTEVAIEELEYPPLEVSRSEPWIASPSFTRSIAASDSCRSVSITLISI
jgi:hypothetical protein